MVYGCGRFYASGRVWVEFSGESGCAYYNRTIHMYEPTLGMYHHRNTRYRDVWVALPRGESLFTFDGEG